MSGASFCIGTIRTWPYQSDRVTMVKFLSIAVNHPSSLFVRFRPPPESQVEVSILTTQSWYLLYAPAFGILCFSLSSVVRHFPKLTDRLQHNHKHEFFNTLLNQLFQEQQPSYFQCNTIPPLAIIFAINWSVGYWWRRSGY